MSSNYYVPSTLYDFANGNGNDLDQLMGRRQQSRFDESILGSTPSRYQHNQRKKQLAVVCLNALWAGIAAGTAFLAGSLLGERVTFLAKLLISLVVGVAVYLLIFVNSQFKRKGYRDLSAFGI